MKNKLLVVALFALAALLPPTCARANNNLFLPGDAFFPTLLTKAEIEALQATPTGERLFEYSPLGGYYGAFCGYAGYNNAVIPAVDDQFANNLATVFARISEHGAQQSETNGMGVLFYPSQFKFPQHSLGLRYNENWVAEAVKFGHRREDLRLCSLIPKATAVERSWRDAKLVPPLDVKLPAVERKPVPVTEAPVVAQGSVKAMVIGSHSLMELYERKGDGDLTIYVVDSKEITQLVFDRGQWKPAESH